MQRNFWVVLFLVFTIGLILSGCRTSPAANEPAKEAEEEVTESAKEEPKELPATVGMGTYAVGSTGYIVGTGVAKVVSEFSPIKVIAQPTAGPNAFVPLMDSGELQLGLQTGNDVGWAYTGGTGYDKAYKSIRVLVRGHDIPTIPLVVRVDSGIKSTKDLLGKRVAGEYGGSKSILAVVTAGLEAGGLTWDDVNVVPVPDPSTGNRALQEGRIDACFGGNPNGAQYLEIDTATPLHVLNFGDIPPEQSNNPPKEIFEILKKHQPAADVYLQKKEGYLKSDATIIIYPYWFTASSELSADAAYEIVKHLYENDKELHPIHQLLSLWKQETMFDPAPNAPYHEGAVRFWKEIGLWTPEAEANQTKLLEQ